MENGNEEYCDEAAVRGIEVNTVAPEGLEEDKEDNAVDGLELRVVV